MFKVLKVKVRRSPQHVQHVEVPAWELPVLQAVHGAGVTVEGERFLARELPDADTEFSRLSRRYKHPESSPEAPYVSQVYGAFGPGVMKLRDEIARAAPKAEEAGSAAPAEMEDVDPLVA